MRRALRLLILTSLPVLRIPTAEVLAQSFPPFPVSPSLQIPLSPSYNASVLPSNSVSHIVIRGQDIWLGTGKGLARTSDGGRSFVSFRYVPQFARPGIFALDVRGDTIWAANGYTKEVDGGTVQTGAGYAYSTNNGSTWSSVGQPLDPENDSLVAYGINSVRFIPIIVPEQNVTFDLALANGTVWIASWSSGLRKSTDNGNHWQRIVLPSRSRNAIAPTDTLVNYLVDPRLDNNFLLFSVYTEDNVTVWAGSAGGVNKSTDGGVSWTKYTVENQTRPILGNWVIAIKGQRFGARSRIWTTNWPAEGAGEKYGVSCTDDSGQTWKNSLAGVKVYDFAFKDTIVYAASEQGLYKSSDAGESWTRSGTVIDPATGERLTSATFYAVGVVADTVFAGSADGFVRTIDNAAHPFGERWEVLRTHQPLSGRSSTYAYPNPFSPRFEVVRIHYSTGSVSALVTIEMFDFGMNRIRTLIHDASRGAGELDEIWDGKDANGSLLPNGVYFYRVTVGGNESAWGKIMVLQ